MPTINLLPWREHVREKHKRQFFLLLLASIGCAIFTLGIMHYISDNNLQQQAKRNQFLQVHMTKLDQRLKAIYQLQQEKQQLLARISIITNLYNSRPTTSYLFSEITRLLPAGIFLEQMQRMGNSITIAGKAESSKPVTQLMHAVTQSTWLTQPVLSEMNNPNPTQAYSCNFKLRFEQQVNVKSPAAREN